MLNFFYNIPTKVFFGEGQIKKLGGCVKDCGASALFLYGGGAIKRLGLYDDVVKQLGAAGIGFVELGGVQPNPRIATVREGARLCREHKLEVVVAVGGGSVIDCAKAIAAAYYYDGDPWDFPSGKAEAQRALPIVSVLTLSATGSEMNNGAVISNDETREKLPMFGPLHPVYSILDPTYTMSLPPAQTAAGVADILSHLFEQYFSPTADTFIQDRLAEALMATCIEFGPRALAKPDDYDARAQLMWASSLSLNGLLSCGKRGDWAVHMIEHELSAYYDVTHGAGLATLTPPWMNHCLDKKTSPRLAAYGRNVWRLAGDDDLAVGRAAVEKTAAFLFDSLKLPRTLAALGCPADAPLKEIAANAVRFGALGQFKKLEAADVLAILEAAR